MRIIDTFTFYNEFDILYYRLSLLYDIVDKFIIVEATKTHKGNDKPLFFQENRERFKEFEDKIIHVIDCELAPDAKHDISKYLHDEVWQNENHQRNSIDYGIQTLNLAEDDIIIVSDVDEIPNPAVLINLNPTQIYSHKLLQEMYYYNLTCKSNYEWTYSWLGSYGVYINNYDCKPQACRENHNIPFIANGGWHLSYFGDAAFIQNKLKQFAHQEFNNEAYTDLKTIENRIKNKHDLFGRDNEQWSNVPIKENPNLPPGYEEFLVKFT
jgi:beta-1,4-mannosyl-glycoprotein beta-1,4-N-acetylglucosaminyltransferase